MKKYILPLLMILFLTSCSDDIETNSPGLQAETDLGFFHTLEPVVYTNEDGTFSIVGEQGSKKIELTLTSITEGEEYELGGESPNVATYLTEDEVLYSTDSLGDGSVKIKTVENGEIYGSFGFNARVNGHTGDTLNFSQGAFFGVPMADGSANNDDEDDLENLAPDCLEAYNDAMEAFEAYYEAIDSEDENWEEIAEACNNYKDAVYNLLEVCGEDDLIDDELVEGIEDLDCDMIIEE